MLDDEPYLAVHSGRIGAVVDALASPSSSSGQPNLLPRLGLISDYGQTTFDPLTDLPPAVFGATLNVSSPKQPNSATGAYHLGLRDDRTFVVRQGRWRWR